MVRPRSSSEHMATVSRYRKFGPHEPFKSEILTLSRTSPVYEWCSPPTFGYDITNMVYQTADDAQTFSLNRAIETTSDSSAIVLTKVLAVLFPLSLFYSVVALTLSIFCKRNVVVVVTNSFCFGATAAALGVSLGFNSMVKDFWIIQGSSSQGSGDIVRFVK
jgi:hypothetical protein